MTSRIYDFFFRYVFLWIWGRGFRDSYLRIFHLGVYRHWNAAATLLQKTQQINGRTPHLYKKLQGEGISGVGECVCVVPGV